jgi:hypothetical protein
MKQTAKHNLDTYSVYHFKNESDIYNFENFITHIKDVCFEQMIFEAFNIFSLKYGNNKNNIEFITLADNNEQTLFRKKGNIKPNFIVFKNIID